MKKPGETPGSFDTMEQMKNYLQDFSLPSPSFRGPEGLNSVSDELPDVTLGPFPEFPGEQLRFQPDFLFYRKGQTFFHGANLVSRALHRACFSTE
jgi:hypothetical protein